MGNRRSWASKNNLAEWKLKVATGGATVAGRAITEQELADASERIIARFVEMGRQDLVDAHLARTKAAGR